MYSPIVKVWEKWIFQNLKILKNSLFFGCISLKKVNLPGLIEVVPDDKIFSLCRSLGEIIIPEKLKRRKFMNGISKKFISTEISP